VLKPGSWSLSIKLAIAVGAGFFALFLVLAVLSLRAVDQATTGILYQFGLITPHEQQGAARLQR